MKLAKHEMKQTQQYKTTLLEELVDKNNKTIINILLKTNRAKVVKT